MGLFGSIPFIGDWLDEQFEGSTDLGLSKIPGFDPTVAADAENGFQADCNLVAWLLGAAKNDPAVFRALWIRVRFGIEASSRHNVNQILSDMGSPWSSFAETVIPLLGPLTAKRTQSAATIFSSGAAALGSSRALVTRVQARGAKQERM